MKPRRIALDSIQVSRQCSAEWDLMKGDKQTRHCHECDRKVYNLSSMTGPEAESLISNSPKRICVRFERLPDGSILTEPAYVLPTLFRRRVVQFSGALATALFSVSTGAFARTSVQDKKPASYSLSSVDKRAVDLPQQTSTGPATITGNVFDPSGALVTQATVTLLNESDKTVRTTKSSESGSFEFQYLTEGTFTIRVESPGFIVFEKPGVVCHAGERIQLDFALLVGRIEQGGVIMFEEMPIQRKTILETLLIPFKKLTNLFSGKPQ